MVLIGIDFGTSNSTVAVSRQGIVEVFENEQGRRQTPSCVAFTNKERLIGEEAMMQASRNVQNTILDAKVLIGRSFEDARMMVKERKWPYTLINNKGKPQFQVKYRGQVKLLYPEEIIAMILLRMKKIAEHRLQDVVTGAVITVPSSFNAVQRQAIADAATIAGVPPVRLVNETVAAGVAFAAKEQPTSQLKVLMIHVGGGTFDATVLAVSENECKIKGTDGDSSLGGDRYHDAVFDELYTELISTGGDLDKQAYKLRLACKKAKEELALSSSATITVDGVGEGMNMKKRMTEDIFEKLNEINNEAIKRSIQESLKRAKLGAGEIDNVVFVGAGTRADTIRKIVANIGIRKSKIRKTINVEEAPATGAAILAEILSSETIPVNDIFTQDIINYSMQLCVNSYFRVVPTEGLRLPTKRLVEISGTQGHLLAFEIRVKGHKNENLGYFNIRTLYGVHLPKVISVAVEITVDGLLEVSAFSSDAEINFTKKTGIDEKEIQYLKRESKKFLEDEESNKNASRVLHRLEKDLYEVKSLITKIPSLHTRDELFHDYDIINKWIDENSAVTMEGIEDARKQLQILRLKIEIGKKARLDESVAVLKVQDRLRDYYELNDNHWRKLGANLDENAQVWAAPKQKSPKGSYHQHQPLEKYEHTMRSDEVQRGYVEDATEQDFTTYLCGIDRTNRNPSPYAARENDMGGPYGESYEFQDASPTVRPRHALLATPPRNQFNNDISYSLMNAYPQSPLHFQGACAGDPRHDTRNHLPPTALKRDRHDHQYLIDEQYRRMIRREFHNRDSQHGQAKHSPTKACGSTIARSEPDGKASRAAAARPGQVNRKLFAEGDKHRENIRHASVRARPKTTDSYQVVRDGRIPQSIRRPKRSNLETRNPPKKVWMT